VAVYQGFDLLVGGLACGDDAKDQKEEHGP